MKGNVTNYDDIYRFTSQIHRVLVMIEEMAYESTKLAIESCDFEALIKIIANDLEDTLDQFHTLLKTNQK